MSGTGAVTIMVLPAKRLQKGQRVKVLNLCSTAFRQPMEAYLKSLQTPYHVLAYQGEALVSHAAWVPRWLQVNGAGLLPTAYVEAVATSPDCQGRGYGSAVVRKLVACLDAYALAALSPTVPPFYQRMGWEAWRGPLAIRTAQGPQATPQDEIMIHRLPRTPRLDVHAPLSAEWRPGEVW